MSDQRPLAPDAAAAYAAWFAALADPTRVRLLHAVGTSRSGALRVGHLASALKISQSTASHHVRRLAEAGLLAVEKVGTSSVVTLDPAWSTALPHVADLVLGTLAGPPHHPDDPPDDHPDDPPVDPPDVVTRAMRETDLTAVRDIYADGVATRMATFETEVPPVEQLATRWLPEHRWVAEHEGQVVGWAAVGAVSSRACYAGVGETSVYVAPTAQGHGVGTSLLHRLVDEADARGLWTLQAAIFPENPASIALHHSAGFQTLAVRSRIARLNGVWRDTVLLERRRAGDE
ncbi:metalloregulator ArsR/SmtB family transcription factor [Nocardioides sp. cx-173]|uniref:metalloregulator ArsR/SmtB family transcription factor n=1 Tax=Nocardioides sp. cx-173 TaxID=2898796 RepID=UPI001E497022|nr:metalloregulator ArsR/SmtB family transcription factor [Nocardioides sp. cx-173]MCD4526907.1 metalloregulator ArsR/SmtB family transcription factor [Nocardioides sp. cx-173]UGB41305.1 metalloregulator ArsR/SmtB family transcription factor [Nocardioides sp. cx-173]